MDYELNESFSINNDNLADWAIRKIKEDEAERDRLIAIAQDQINELTDQIENLKIKYDGKTKFLKGHLQMYFGSVPHKETKTQESYKLLSGSLVMKKASAKIIYDDDALLAYLVASSQPEYIKVKKSVDWVEYKKNLGIEGRDVIDLDTGEIIKACSVEDVPASFDIKF